MFWRTSSLDSIPSSPLHASTPSFAVSCPSSNDSRPHDGLFPLAQWRCHIFLENVEDTILTTVRIHAPCNTISAFGRLFTCSPLLHELYDLQACRCPFFWVNFYESIECARSESQRRPSCMGNVLVVTLSKDRIGHGFLDEATDTFLRQLQLSYYVCIRSFAVDAKCSEEIIVGQHW